ncbi:MAG: phasin family protein [Geobacter sp.]|nr:phasin family protein [Geobacter sp.]
MLELLEKAFLTGLGAISVTQKKGEELVAEFREKYKASEEEGKAFLEKIQKMAIENREKLTEAAEEEVRKAIEKLGAVPMEDFHKLEKRVAALEKKLKG